MESDPNAATPSAPEPGSDETPPSGEQRAESRRPLRVVGIGASAGGLEALEVFFSHLRADTGMAFVVIQHLSPDFRSVMDELLSRRTSMPVVLAEEGMCVERDRIYLLPRKAEMTIAAGVLHLVERDPEQALPLPIDVFLQSLAADQGERAAAVILSGTGSDGSRGARAVNQAGGLVFAQSVESARFDGMPRAAIETETVDFVLPPEKIPEVLTAYSGTRSGIAGADILKLARNEFDPVFALLKDHHGIDFHAYKPATMRRRLERRMVLRETPSLDDYVGLLREEAEEREALFVDLLIGVTRFFRDEEAFASLREGVLPRLLKNKAGDDEVRAWVCGCATGEEAYSIAILLNEATREAGRQRVKVFATDVHRRTLDLAARGIFSPAQMAGVPENLRERYFHCEGESCRVRPELRQMVVFSEHNVTDDPPFTKIDLISCRNLLIYLQGTAQRKALSLFHFALQVGGVLMLGPSESLGSLDGEFEVLDRHWKIFSKRRNVRVLSPLREMSSPISAGRVVLPGKATVRPTVDARLARAYDELLARHMPPSVLVDENRHLLHSFAEVGRYFAPITGRPSLDLVDMLKGDLRVAVAAALQRAIKEDRTVAYQGVMHAVAEKRVRLNLTVVPIADSLGGGRLFHLLFEEHAVYPPAAAAPEEVVEDFSDAEAPTQQRIRDLELELQYSKEHLQTTVEELETSNEELQATNEELLASNEELQSTNEELHSVNEELYTVNAEYEKKNRELLELNTDIDNLLQSTEIGTLFLDTNLEVRRFTPAIRTAFNLLPQDVGRSIADITYRIEGHDDLWEDSKRVLEQDIALDRRVRSREGRDLLLRLRPYRTAANDTAGVVLTFVDISELTEAQRQLAESEARFRRVANSTPALLWMVDESLAGVYFNHHWREFGGRQPDELEASDWLDFIVPEDRQRFREEAGQAAAGGDPLTLEVRMRNGAGETRWMRLSGTPRQLDEDRPVGFIFTAIDIDDIRNAAESLRRQVEERTEALRSSEEFFRLVGETATDGYWDWDLERDTVYLSPSFKALLGYAQEEIGETLQSWHALLHPEDRPLVERALEQHFDEEAPLDLVVRGLHRDGDHRWMILRGVALRDEAGRCYRMIGTHTDITVQKRAETRIRASEERFRKVFQSGLMGIGLVDRELQIVEANDRLLSFLGRRREDLPLSIKAISDEAGVEVSLELVAEARDRGLSSIREKQYFRPEGPPVTVRLGYSLIDPRSGELVVMVEDISTERASRDALRRSEDRLARAIEATRVGLFDWKDPLGTGQIWGSAEFFRMFGFPAEDTERPGSDVLDRVHPEDRDRLREAIEAVLASPEADFNLDYRVQEAGRGLRWLYSRGRLIGEEGEDLRLVGTAQDVTERYASQASLRLKTELLEKSNQDLEQFAYIASHDLKEPLRTVTGYLQILSSRYRGQIDAEGGEFILRAVNASNRMHALIDGLLEFSRIGRLNLKFEPVDLREAIEIATSQLQAAIAETDTEIELVPMPTVEGDVTLLARVFLNLIGNSIKFSGGKQPRIRISAQTRNNHVRVMVSDNGIGIDPKFAQRIFVIFQRLHTREEYPGTGIGLSVCRKIMERHGGCIWLESEAEGEGATIGLAFPLQPPE